MSDDFLGSIGGEPAEFAPAPTRSFKAWHRPRKQWVRRNQWVRHILEVFPDLPPTLSYLSLPGDDLLDVRFLHDEVCEGTETKLRYLGFNSSMNPTSASIAQASSQEFSVNRLFNIDERSDIVADLLESVAQENSIGHSKVRTHGPFDIVNLDFTGGVAVATPVNRPNIFAALRVLIENQSKRTDDSLLFLTFRFDDQQVDQQIREKLDSALAQMIDDCGSLGAAIDNLWEVREDGTREPPLDAGTRLLLGFACWLAQVCDGLRLEAFIESAYTYKVRPQEAADDLASFAIRLKPIRILEEDPYGLAQGEPSVSRELSFCKVVAKVPARIRHAKSVDAKLRGDASVRGEMVEESSKLLEAAGWDVSEYSAWAATYP